MCLCVRVCSSTQIIVHKWDRVTLATQMHIAINVYRNPFNSMVELTAEKNVSSNAWKYGNVRNIVGALEGCKSTIGKKIDVQAPNHRLPPLLQNVSHYRTLPIYWIRRLIHSLVNIVKTCIYLYVLNAWSTRTNCPRK